MNAPNHERASEIEAVARGANPKTARALLDLAARLRDPEAVAPHGSFSVQDEVEPMSSREDYERACRAHSVKPAPDALVAAMGREGHLDAGAFPPDLWLATFRQGNVGRAKRARWVLDRSYWVGVLSVTAGP